MNIELSDEALEYGRQAQRALESAGGDQLVQLAEGQPERREAVVAPVLAELGAWDLDPRAGADELEAAAALCRSVGWWAVPYPIAERISRPAELDLAGLVVVAGARPAGAVGCLDGSWATVTLDGQRGMASGRPLAVPPRKSAFVTDLDVVPVDGASPDDASAGDVALGLVLPCWTLLGMLDRAMALTRAYVLERVQFDQPLAAFQGVQFQLTEAEVERVGVEELAKYTLWSVESGREEAVDDVLALRAAAIEAADVVFRVTHQLHGAIGFCDETTLSWVSRYSQPLRRLPLGLTATGISSPAASAGAA